jgi:biopolymer transport protein ExbB
MVEVFSSGGVLMLPILLCSIAVLAIGLERWWSLRRSQVLPEALLARLENVAGWSAQAGALNDLGATSQLGYVLAVGLKNLALPHDQFHQVLRGAIDLVAHNLERYLTVLGVIAAICPLLGILGTVVGLIDVFDQLFAAQQAQTHLLAGGISTALVTTAAGLVVAIPALICHRVLLRHVDALLIEIEAVSSRFLEQMRAAK